MGLNLGGGVIDAIRLGGDAVDKVMLGDAQVWPPIKPFIGEFTMADVTGHFKTLAYDTSQGTLEYSSDKVNWIDMPATDLDVTGSLKWYVRQKAGRPTCKKVSFGNSDFITVDKLLTGNITDFSKLFFICTKLINIPLIDTSNGEVFASTFSRCESLVTIPAIDTSKATFFGRMFSGCTKLITIPPIDVGNGSFFRYMFYGCTALTSVPALNTDKGDNFQGFFQLCSSLKCIAAINTVMNSECTSMFTGTSSLVSPNIADQQKIIVFPTGLDWTNPDPCPIPPPAPPTNFKVVPDFTSIALSWDKSITGPMDEYRAYVGGVLKQTFAGDVALGTITGLTQGTDYDNITIRGFVGGVETLDSNSEDAKTLEVTEFEGEFTMGSASDYFRIEEIHTDKASIQYSKDKTNWVDMTTNVDVTGSLKWYVRQKPGAPTLVQVGFLDSDFVEVNSIYTAKITSFVSMFNGCKKLTKVPELYTSKGVSFSTMFKDCHALTSIPAMDTSRGSHFSGMFMHCGSLVCLTSINTTRMTVAFSMFSSTAKLQHPTLAEQGKIVKRPGLNYTNTNKCP